ncbi:MAG TPA: hypothetical protein DCM73_11200 [Clostridiales bacterium]|nr:hypothetical protein [Clostridiales bacterium]
MSECKECYSSKKRITPLLKPRECLENHLQYICGTCGRCICINKTEKGGLQRWNFPFKSLETAKLYLRAADVTTKNNCGIYEVTGSNGRKSYRIFPSEEALDEFLQKNKGKSCATMQSIYRRPIFEEFPNSEIRKLSLEEVDLYIKEQKEGE